MTLTEILSPKNRSLLSELVRTEFKLRYQGSVLGYAWSLLRPLLLFVILYVVFVKFLRVGDGVPHFPIYLLLGIVLWTFFVEMTNSSLTSITSRGDMIKKVRIPKWIIILSSSISALISLGLNLVVVLIFTIINQVELHVSVAFFPLILVEIYIPALGLSLFLAAAYVRYRDVSYIWEVVLQAGFYITPILYPVTLIADPFFQKLILLNPMAQVIQDARYAIVTQEAVTLAKAFGVSPLVSILPFLACCVVLAGGVLFFRSQSKNFAENL